MGDSIFEGPSKQNARFLKQHNPRNTPKQSPEEGPKLDPKKVRETCDFEVKFGGAFLITFFLFGSLGPLMAQLEPPLLATFGTLLAHLGPLLPLHGVIWGPS